MSSNLSVLLEVGLIKKKSHSYMMPLPTLKLALKYI